MNQCWHIDNLTHRNKLQRNINQNSNIFMHLKTSSGKWQPSCLGRLHIPPAMHGWNIQCLKIHDHFPQPFPHNCVCMNVCVLQWQKASDIVKTFGPLPDRRTDNHVENPAFTGSQNYRNFSPESQTTTIKDFISSLLLPLTGQDPRTRGFRDVCCICGECHLLQRPL